MMRNVVLLVCVVLTQGLVLMKRDARLPVPQISKITAVDPPGFQIEWERINADIVGYRFPPSDDIPENKPRIYTVSAQDEPALIATDIKLNTIYEARVQVFDNKEDGPLSGPLRIKHG